MKMRFFVFFDKVVIKTLITYIGGVRLQLVIEIITSKETNYILITRRILS